MKKKKFKHDIKKRSIEDGLKLYQQKRPLYIECGAKLFELFRELLAQESIRFQAIEHRAKTPESLRDKLSRPRRAYPNGLEDITDLCGLRIITYSLSDVSRVCDLVEREFDAIPQHSVDKRAILPLAEFGYRSRHFVVKLKASRSTLSEWKRFTDLRIEIQVRTVLEHAWAAIDHSLRYKREADVPREQKRALFQLSALLELADDNFDRLKNQQEILRDDAAENVTNLDSKTLELNSLSYGAYSESSEVLKKLTNLAYAAGFEPPDGEDEVYSQDERDSVSDLVVLAKAQGIRSVNELDAALQNDVSSAPKYFEDLFEQSSGTWIANSTFIAVLCLIRRDVSLTRGRLRRVGFDGEIAERVLAVAKRHRSDSERVAKTR